MEEIIKPTRKSKDKEYIKNYNKEYYNKTRVARLNDIKQKVRCELCDKELTKGKLTNHNKSKTHKIHLYLQEEYNDI
jgi:hypothetical protein